MKNKTYYVGFDIGGTSTNFYIENANAEMISHEIRDGLNFSSTEKSVILEFLESLFKNTLDDEAHYSIYCAVAGLVDKDLKNDLNLKFTSSQITIRFDDDISLMLNLLPKNQKNALMILGTGSVMILKNSDNSVEKIGGWGKEFDTFNGAYSFGQAFIRVLIEDFENDRIRFPELIEEKYTEKYIRKLVLSKSNYREISKYAEQLFRLCEKENIDALTIFDLLFSKLETRIKKLKQFQSEKLFLYGGLLKNSYFKSRFFKLLSEYKLDYKLIDTAAEKVACQIARRTTDDS